jgi:hypothetical protein
MMNIEIRLLDSNNAVGDKLNLEIVDKKYKGNKVTGYVGDMKVYIKTKMSQKQFDMFCEGKLSNREIDRLKICGIL